MDITMATNFHGSGAVLRVTMILAWLALGVAPASLRAGELVAVDDDTFSNYWVLDQKRMPPVLPPSARGTVEIVKRYGELRFEYRVTINSDGVPEEFELIALEPEGADPRPFIALMMMHRYRPAEGMAPTPVRLYRNDPIWIPEAPGALPTE